MSVASCCKVASATLSLGACLAVNSCEALNFIREQAGIRKAQIVRARMTANNLVFAVRAYHDDNASLPPVEAPGNKPSLTTGPKLMGVLTGLDNDRNPKQERYYQGPLAAGGKGGLSWEEADGEPSVRLLDPWGNEYFMSFDSDFDDKIADPFNPAKPLRGLIAIAWSAGPDGKTHPDPLHDDNADNVFSWK